ncbi:MAG: Hsp20/alpha crystallin family protein [Haloarculaceae archaeon]
MTTRSNPFEELERLVERMSRQFETASETWGTGEALETWTGGMESMAVDLAEHEDEYDARVDLPGFDQDDIEVSVTDSTLTIEAHHEDAAEAEGDHYLRRERTHRSQERSIHLPGEVDTDAVEATMKHGVLTVTLPKVETEQAKEITIE